MHPSAAQPGGSAPGDPATVQQLDIQVMGNLQSERALQSRKSLLWLRSGERAHHERWSCGWGTETGQRRGGTQCAARSRRGCRRDNRILPPLPPFHGRRTDSPIFSVVAFFPYASSFSLVSSLCWESIPLTNWISVSHISHKPPPCSRRRWQPVTTLGLRLLCYAIYCSTKLR